MRGFGTAIDVAAAHSQYWLRAKLGAGGHIAYKNEIPLEIVRIFEAHGFIWGGKWYHYDTMHFEYRPELIGGGEVNALNKQLAKLVTNVRLQTQPTYPTPIAILLAQRG